MKQFELSMGLFQLVASQQLIIYELWKKLLLGKLLFIHNEYLRSKFYGSGCDYIMIFAISGTWRMNEKVLITETKNTFTSFYNEWPALFIELFIRSHFLWLVTSGTTHLTRKCFTFILILFQLLHLVLQTFLGTHLVPQEAI